MSVLYIWMGHGMAKEPRDLRSFVFQVIVDKYSRTGWGHATITMAYMNRNIWKEGKDE